MSRDASTRESNFESFQLNALVGIPEEYDFFDSLHLKMELWGDNKRMRIWIKWAV